MSKFNFEEISKNLKLGVPGKVVGKDGGKVVRDNCRWISRDREGFIVLHETPDGIMVTEGYSDFCQFVPTVFKGWDNSKDMASPCIVYAHIDGGSADYNYQAIGEHGGATYFMNAEIAPDVHVLTKGQTVTLKTEDGREVKAVIQ